VLERRPRVLAILPALFPSTIIGVAKPLLRLHQDRKITLDLTLQYLVSRRAVERCDVVVMCHTIDPVYGGILDWARALNKPLIYEIDDDLLDVPTDIPGLAYLREPARLEQLIACIRQADVVRVYSTALQEKLSAYNDNVTVVSGPLDWSLMPPVAPPPEPGRVNIVYATSRLDDTLGTILLAPLRRVLDRCPQAWLTIWGPRTHSVLAGHPRVRFLPLIRDYDDFFAKFARERFDIGLAPLPHDEFHRGKSNNKFREYAACGIAGVYSNTSVYNTSVEHNVTGVLVENTGAEWEAAVERLIVDPEQRVAIGERARAYARAHFNETITDGAWIEAIERLGAPRTSAAPIGTAAVPGEKLVGLARFGGRLSTKIGPVLRAHGPGEVVRRIWVHLVGFGQLLTWEIQRWRLQRHVNAHRGRS
jgi:glycosyltransferase involved in cell wall biosynthesis